MCIDEFNGDNFDHGPLGFVGGGYMGAVQTNGRPIQTTPVPQGTPRWGAAVEEGGARELSQHATRRRTHGSCYSYRDAYLDLDPTYTDRFGRQLLRMTFDFHDNELKMSALPDRPAAEIVKADGRAADREEAAQRPYDITIYQTTHTCGGAVMGTDPKTSALNRYLQSWDVPNLFVMGATAFPQNAGYNPTGTVGALAFWAADAIGEQYLKNPGRWSMRNGRATCTRC